MNTGRLSRRDRAAMQLALEVLRQHYWGPERAAVGARRVLSEGGATSLEVLGASCAVSAIDHGRLLRARLALALRVLLRVDAGDYGHRWWYCPECGSDGHTRWQRPLGSCVASSQCDGERAWGDYKSTLPLWESAPAHGGAR